MAIASRFGGVAIICASFTSAQRLSTLDELRKFARRQRAAEVVALNFVASTEVQKVELLARLNPLSAMMRRLNWRPQVNAPAAWRVNRQATANEAGT